MIREFINVTYCYYKTKSFTHSALHIKPLFPSIKQEMTSNTGNFETLGSKFRHETKGLLPSFATIDKVNYTFRTPHQSVIPLHKQVMTFHSSTSIRSRFDF